MMFRVVKWLMASVLVIFFSIYLAITSLYYLGLEGLPDDLSPSKTVYSQDLLHAEWIAQGETGEIQTIPLSPTGYLHVAFKFLNHSPQHESRFLAPSGLRAATQGARILLARRQIQNERTIARHWHEAVAAIWITNHWNATETLNTLLENGYFGSRPNGVEAAALRYFEKEISQLDIQEIALLLAIKKGPSHYDPWCHRDRALSQANLWLDRLSANWPQKYGKLAPLTKMPDHLVNYGSVICGGR